MTEYRDPATSEDTNTGAMADEPIPDAWGASQGGPEGSPGAQKGREWLSQLESMIQDVATQAAPIARQVAAKAAELAAVAGEKAGPFAQRAAEVTTEAGQKLAEKATRVAADLRSQQADAGGPSVADAATEAGVTDTGAEARDTTPS